MSRRQVKRDATVTYGGKRLSPEARERQRVYGRAEPRALRRLKAAHLDEFYVLLDEELAREEA